MHKHGRVPDRGGSHRSTSAARRSSVNGAPRRNVLRVNQTSENENGIFFFHEETTLAA